VKSEIRNPKFAIIQFPAFSAMKAFPALFLESDDQVSISLIFCLGAG
jgi:hypothetical protein